MLPTDQGVGDIEHSFNPLLNERPIPFIKSCIVDFSKIVPCATLFISFITLVVMCYVINEANLELVDAGEVLSDAGETVADMNTIIPEIRSSLKILTSICATPQFYSICHGIK